MARWLLAVVGILVSAAAVARAAEVYEADGQGRVQIPYAEDLNEEMLYYLFEWGDGTVAPSSLRRSGIHGAMEHRYAKAGTYEGRFRAVSVGGRLGEWRTFRVNVGQGGGSGEPVVATRGAWAGGGAEGYWEREACELQLGGYHALDRLVLAKAPGKPFPSHFRIEYSTNGGRTWQKLNTAQCFFFPDPGKQKVVFSFNGVAANAVRLLATRSTPGQPVHLGGMQATGSKELLFDCSERGPFIAGLNNLWYAYGSAVNEVHLDHASWSQSKRPFESGVSYMGNAEWFAWDALQMGWTNIRELGELRAKWLDYPMDPDGYVWACPADPRHLFHNRHYDNNACYINGIVHYVLQTGDEAFMRHPCAATGKTNLEKLRLAMRYQLEQLGGATGVLTITDPETQGTPGSKSGNYWDYYKFGHQSAFDNAEFHRSLRSMARLERHLGDEAKAAEYEALAAKAKKEFNRLFWNEEAGRYIGCIAADGVRRDFGFTFVNLHALAYGLADEPRARRILAWLDGERVVEGETSTGADIYRFRIGPRSNTIDMANDPDWVETWGGELHPARQGRYGMQIQNGGVIFYVSYYDLHSRLRHQGIDGAMERLDAIMEEFELDEIRRIDSNHTGHTLILGVLLCFPESGLVPMFYLDGILGLAPDAAGLRIAPSLPPAWQWASVKSYWFRGREYSVRVDRTAAAPRVRSAGGRTEITVPADGTFVLNADGAIVEEVR